MPYFKSEPDKPGRYRVECAQEFDGVVALCGGRKSGPRGALWSVSGPQLRDIERLIDSGFNGYVYQYGYPANSGYFVAYNHELGVEFDNRAEAMDFIGREPKPSRRQMELAV